MTVAEFRALALKLQDAVEGAHMGHPDFRVNGRVFASLYPNGTDGMVKLTPEQQEDFVAADAQAFEPANGAWGRQGCTTVHLGLVDEDRLGEAMTLAWQNTVKLKPVRKKKVTA
jgi:YjbR